MSTTNDLRISSAHVLPRGIVTHRNALLGMSGSGKSNAATVLQEEMYRLSLPWIAIDPKGDGWGIRSSTDGKKTGLDVPILGGEHGDLPLQSSMGKVLGELVAANKLFGIFDLSGFETDGEKATFMEAFGRALFHARRLPIHIFCDECHEYMPQPGAGGRLDGPAAKCVSVWKRILSQGRQRGIGVTLSSQRAANVNKTCLTQCETLFAFRTTGRRDRDAIEDWVDSVGDAKAVLAALPRLADGECFLWSPTRLRIEERIQFRRRSTYDSGRTPDVDEAQARAPKLAQLDLEELRAALAEETDDADGGEEHAAKLERALAETKEELRKARAAALPLPVLARFEKATAELHESGIAAIEAARDLRAALPAERTIPPGSPPKVVQRDAKPANTKGKGVDALLPVSRGAAHDQAEIMKVRPVGNGKFELVRGKCESGLLAALRQHGPLKLAQAAIIAGYSPAASTCRVAIGKLRQAGLVTPHSTPDGRLELTTAGVSASDGLAVLPCGRALGDWWLTQLGKCERVILNGVLRAHPKPAALTDIAERAAYSTAASTIRVAVGKLRKLELVSGSNTALVPNEKLVG
jgi:uncharacterized protein